MSICCTPWEEKSTMFSLTGPSEWRMTLKEQKNVPVFVSFWLNGSLQKCPIHFKFPTFCHNHKTRHFFQPIQEIKKKKNHLQPSKVSLYIKTMHYVNNLWYTVQSTKWNLQRHVGPHRHDRLGMESITQRRVHVIKSKSLT